MSQICIPSIHKATNPLRFHNKTLAPKKRHCRSDDIAKKETNHLHTIGRIGSMPVSPGYLKQEIAEYMKNNPNLPRYYNTTEYSNNKSTSVWIRGFGAVHIQFRQAEFEGLSS